MTTANLRSLHKLANTREKAEGPNLICKAVTLENVVQEMFRDGAGDIIVTNQGAKFSVKIDHKKAFCINEWKLLNCKFARPFLVEFSTNSAPPGFLLARVVVWPGPEPVALQARYLKDGQITLNASQALTSILNELGETNGCKLQVTLSYGGVKRGSWREQWSVLSTTNNFPKLAEKFRRWNTNYVSVSNLLALRKLVTDRPVTMQSTVGCLEEVSQICELLLQSRMLGGNGTYDFKANASEEAQRFLDDLDRERSLNNDLKESIRQKWNKVDLVALKDFIKEEDGDAAIPSLAQAKDRLEYYVTKTGGPVLDHFTGTITLKDGESGTEIMLMAFKF